MGKIITYCCILLFLACNKEVKPERSAISENRAALEMQYSQIDSLLQVSLDSLEVHLNKMETAAASESDTYKSLPAIGYGILHSNRSSYELSRKNYEKALQLLGKSPPDTLLARVYNGIGSSLKNTGDYPRAFDYLFNALKIYEKRKDQIGIAGTNCNIAQIYLQKNDIDLAKDHLEIAMQTMNNAKWHPAYLHSAHTLANIYGMSGDYKSALKLDEEGIRITDSIGSTKLKAPFVDNKANCFLYSNQLDSAQYYFEQCLQLDLRSGNQKQIADTYSNLGELARFKKDFAGAETAVLKSINLLEKIDHKPNLFKSYEILTDIYRDWGKIQLALDTQVKVHEIYKKMMNEKKEAALAEYKIVHETEQKEKIIAQNRVDLLVKEREVKQRNSMLIGISLLAFFIALTGWLVYRQQKLKNRQQEQEHKLKTAISQIETQNKLQEQRLSISRDLHDNIGAQLTFIISSVDNIKYAFDLKNTKLEHRLQSINNFTKATIIELRDTIWAMNNSEIKFEDLRVRIYNFIEKAKDAREEIDFKFHIDPELSQITLTSITGMNIYRTIQEAINNAIKYANATQISISITDDSSQIMITIIDSGDGFDPETTERGSGLANMQKRIEDIGGKFILAANKSNGTRIVLQLEKQKISSKSAT